MQTNLSEAGFSDRQNVFRRLLDDIAQRPRQPEDKWEVAAILESTGLTDNTAARLFGVADVFELADLVWDRIRSKVVYLPGTPRKPLTYTQYLGHIIRSFLRGSLFALPIVLSVAAMVIIKLSLWSYLYLPVDEATSIAVGTILSFMTVGGFMQAIGHRGFSYIRQDHYNTARRVTFSFVRFGYGVSIAAVIVFVFLGFVFPIFNWRMNLIIILYFLFLCSIWLSVTVMYILQKELIFSGILISGILAVYVLFTIIKLDIIVSQLITLLLVSIIANFMSYSLFLREERKAEKGSTPPMPRLSIIVYSSLPYFAYGFSYFTLLFIDRVMAWSTNSSYMPYLIWFRGAYELGLDFALIVLILPMGLVELMIDKMMMAIADKQQEFYANNVQQMNKSVLSMFYRSVTYVGLFALLNALAVYIILIFLGDKGYLKDYVLIGGVTEFVFIWALLAYSMIAMSLMNVLLMFCLSQPAMAVRAVLYALLADVVSGFLLTRWVDYSWAVIGLFIGALVFLILTMRQTRKLLTNLDYYSYAVM